MWIFSITPKAVSTWVVCTLFALMGLHTEALGVQNAGANRNPVVSPGTATQTINDGIATSAPVPCSPANAKVTDAYKEVNVSQGAMRQDGAGTRPKNTDRRKEVELEDVITVEVENLPSLLAEARCLNRDVVLYLDERPLKNATVHPPVNADSILRFPLKRTEDARDVWTYVLGKPAWESRPTKVSVGLEDKFAIPSESTIDLKVLPRGWFFFWLILFVSILVGFLLMAFKTDLLRDAVPPPEGGGRRPYSLARTQAAWWFFLVLASYLFIGIITGDFSTTVTGTVLGLLGISGGTVVGAAFVDASKASPADSRDQTNAAGIIDTEIKLLDGEMQKIQTEIETAQNALQQNPRDPIAGQTLTTKKADLSAKQAEKEVKLSQWKKLQNESESFFQDLLSDVNGVSFHRFQMLALTIVLGIIFIVQVYKVLAMPTFDGTLLALLGISAGTFLGLKIPEQTVPKK
jgi:Skp family chaperone for outer membrane proteins